MWIHYNASVDEPRSASRPAYLIALCWALWILGAGLVMYGIWLAAALAVGGRWVLGGSAILAGSAAVLAGVGLYRVRRWGVVLFGALALLGSVNHLAGVIQRFPDLSAAAPVLAVGAVIRVLGGFLIPCGLIYFTILLWRQTR